MKSGYFMPAICCFLLISNTCVSQTTTGKLVNLGPQVTETVIQGSAFAQDESGNELLYTVVRGEPAHLLGFELRSNKIITDMPLEKTDGSWDITVSSDGWIYIAGSAGGYLYRHKPGSTAIENLGKVLGTENYLWDLATGRNGEIFGATYPGCKVFRYHPNDGFSDVGKGPLVVGEQYVRSLVYHAKTNKIYAGIGAHAQLVELDPLTGAKKPLLPEKYRDQEFVYNLGLLEGVAGGDRLLLTIQNLKKNLEYNLETHQFTAEANEYHVKSAIKGPDQQVIYYTMGDKLFSRDLTMPGQQSKEIAATNGNAMATKWTKNGQLKLFTTGGMLITYDPTSGRTSRTKLTIPAQAIKIITIARGPESKIWTGGYLTGTNAAYDPKINQTVIYAGLSQTESMTMMDQEIYFGIYPHARFYVYDTGKPWDVKNGNPRKSGVATGQDRPFAALAVKELNKVFFGTVPDYGKNGGALIGVSKGGGKLEVYKDVVANQSIISLTYKKGLLFGGTSVWGGLGVEPVEKDARIFGWDPAKKAKTFDLVPVPGAKAITCLINGPDGNIWGIAAGTLFILDPVTLKITGRHPLLEDGRKGSVWRADELLIHPSGKIYGTVNSKLFSIDPGTMEIKDLKITGSYLTMDDKGKFYFAKSLNLWSYEP
jgi:hypothetical protein